MISWREVMNRTRDSARPRTVFLPPPWLAQSLHCSPPEGSPLLCSIVLLSVSRCDLGVKPGLAVPCCGVPSHCQGFCSLHSCSTSLDWCSLSLSPSLFLIFLYIFSLCKCSPLKSGRGSSLPSLHHRIDAWSLSYSQWEALARCGHCCY